MKIVCPDCSNTYTIHFRTPVNRKPLILTCGHTLCESCIRKRSKKTTASETQAIQVACPTCKHLTPLEDGVKGLPVNIYLCALIGVKQRTMLDLQFDMVAAFKIKPFSRLQVNCSETEDMKCKMCVFEPATCRCDECDSALCTICFQKVHSISAAIRQHKAVPIEHKSLSRFNEEKMCSQHNKMLKYYCEDDSTPICSKCFLVGCHKSHNIMSLEDNNKQFVTDIEKQIPVASLVLENLQKLGNTIVPNFQAETKNLIESISQSFLHLHSLLQAREMEMIKSVTTETRKSMLLLEEQMHHFLEAENDLECALEKANRLLKNNAAVLDGNALLDTLMKARNIPCIMVQKDAAHLAELEAFKWNASHIEDVISAIQMFGSLTGKLDHSFSFKSVEEAESDRPNFTSVGGGRIVPAEPPLTDTATSSYDSGEDAIIESSENTNAESDFMRSGKQVSSYSDIYTPVIKGAPCEVMVTHVCSPNNFFVQLTMNKRQLSTLSLNINNWCRRATSVKQLPLVVSKDMLVLAHYSVDKQWYRARITKIENSEEKGDAGLKVHVHYFDFGNSECVPLKELLVMEPQFMTYPAFAVRCSLSDAAPYREDEPWSVEAVQEFHRMTENQILLLSALAKQNDVLEGDLICMPNENVLDDRFISVRDILIFMELARFRTHSDEAKAVGAVPAYRKVQFISPTVIKKGSDRDVIVTNWHDPGNFHVICQNEEYDYYLHMQADMQQMYEGDISNIYSLYYPQSGTVCSIKHEGLWHRAKALSSPSHRQVCLELVDVGETLSVPCDHLKKLHSQFLKLPAQAVKCQMVNIVPLGGPTAEWSEQARQWGREDMVGVKGILQMVKWDIPAKVVLWMKTMKELDESCNVNMILVELGFAETTSHSLVLEEEEQYSIQTRKTMNESLPGMKERKSSVDTKTCSSSSLKMVSSSSPHGHNSLVQSKPKQSSRSKPRRVWAANPKRKESSPVDKYKLQADIHKALCQEVAEVTETARLTPYIEVVVSSYKNPSHFYIRIEEKEEKLSNLMDDINLYYNIACKTACANEWTVDQYCAFRCTRNDIWYRARIKEEVIPNKVYMVETVDYGETHQVNIDDIRLLTKEFGKILECAAVRCHIVNLLPAGDLISWSQTAIEFMAHHIKERRLFMKQEGEMEEDSLPVDIIVEEEIPETAFDPASCTYYSLHQAIVKHGLAMPKKKQSSNTLPVGFEAASFQTHIFKKTLNTSRTDTSELDSSKDSSQAATSPKAPASPVKAETVENGGPTCIMKPPKKVSFVNLPPYPVLKVGDEIAVVPTWLGMEGIVYCQACTWENKVVHLSQQLQKAFGNAQETSQQPLDPPVAWQEGQLCVAYFPEDKLWYRAAILHIEGAKAEVQYIDYGNTSTVAVSSIRVMSHEFASRHLLSYYCLLNDLSPPNNNQEWPASSLDLVHELVINQECSIIVRELDEGSPIKVELIRKLDRLHLSKYLVDRGLAQDIQDLSEVYQLNHAISQVWHSGNPYHQLQLGGVGDTFKALLVHVELPNLVYLQMAMLPDPSGSDFVAASDVAMINSNIQEFLKMTDMLKSCKSMPFITLPSPGCACAGRYTVDGQWYRVLCVESYAASDSCLVVYVDYGTCEIIARSQIRMLPTEFLEYPIQALRCYFNILPPSGKWTRASVLAVRKALAGKELTVKILQLSPLVVDILEEENGILQPAYESVLDAGLALLPPQESGAEDDDDDAEVEHWNGSEDEAEAKKNGSSQSS